MVDEKKDGEHKFKKRIKPNSITRHCQNRDNRIPEYILKDIEREDQILCIKEFIYRKVNESN